MTFHRYDPRCPIDSVISQTERALDILQEEVSDTPAPPFRPVVEEEEEEAAADPEWEDGYWEEQTRLYEEREALAFL